MIKECQNCGEQFEYDDTMKVHLKMWDGKILHWVCEDCLEQMRELQEDEERIKKYEQVKEWGE